MAKLSRILYFLFSIKRSELQLFFASFSFIFLLFCAYSLLRPVRDALGIEGGSRALKWLFLGTFIFCRLASLALMFVGSKIRRKFYTDLVLGFFVLSLLVFYLALLSVSEGSSGFLWLCAAFYIWVSVGNLFLFSSA